MPPDLGVIVDATWKGSAGFWSRSLRTSNGVQAVILPSRVLENEAALTAMLTHEFTHLIEGQGSEIAVSASWWSEGMAMLAERAVTGKMSPAWVAGLEEPGHGLFESLGFTADELRGSKKSVSEKFPAYGHALQFAAYVDRVCFSGKLLEAYFVNVAKGAGVQDAGDLMSLTSAAGKPLAAAVQEGVCADFDRLFVSFERARFRQAMHRPLDYLIPTTAKPTVQVARPSPKTLPPYSAVAYFPPKGKDHCQAGEEMLRPSDDTEGAPFCLMVRLK